MTNSKPLVFGFAGGTGGGDLVAPIFYHAVDEVAKGDEVGNGQCYPHNLANASALEIATKLVEQIKAGEVVACAVVGVCADHSVEVTISARPEGTYHTLNSGAARLAQQLASEP